MNLDALIKKFFIQNKYPDVLQTFRPIDLSEIPESDRQASISELISSQTPKQFIAGVNHLYINFQPPISNPSQSPPTELHDFCAIALASLLSSTSTKDYEANFRKPFTYFLHNTPKIEMIDDEMVHHFFKLFSGLAFEYSEYQLANDLDFLALTLLNSLPFNGLRIDNLINTWVTTPQLLFPDLTPSPSPLIWILWASPQPTTNLKLDHLISKLLISS